MAPRTRKLHNSDLAAAMVETYDSTEIPWTLIRLQKSDQIAYPVLVEMSMRPRNHLFRSANTSAFRNDKAAILRSVSRTILSAGVQAGEFFVLFSEKSD
jgi:hypothetical protein